MDPLQVAANVRVNKGWEAKEYEVHCFRCDSTMRFGDLSAADCAVLHRRTMTTRTHVTDLRS